MEQVSAERLLQAYQPSAEALELVQNTDVLLLVGISGAGKDTIKQRLLDREGEYYHLVSHTTRGIRNNHGVAERDGFDYHFIDYGTAIHMLRNQELIEAKQYSGNIYGTSVAEIRNAHEQGAIAVTDLEVQGVIEYKALAPSVTAVFVLPPDYQTWQARLRSRYQEGEIDEADISKRMQTAARELRHALDTHYFHFVINDSLETAVAEIDAIAHHQGGHVRDDHAEAVAQQLLARLSA